MKLIYFTREHDKTVLSLGFKKVWNKAIYRYKHTTETGYIDEIYLEFSKFDDKYHIVKKIENGVYRAIFKSDDSDAIVKQLEKEIKILKINSILSD